MIWRTVLALASGSTGSAKLSILMFHRVLPEQDPVFPGDPFAAQFESVVRHVAARFRVLPLLEAVRRLRQGSLPARSLAITFDDGYADNLTIAGPILRRHGLPATVFVTTGFLDGGCMWNDMVIQAFRHAAPPVLDLGSLGLGTLDIRTPERRRHSIQSVLDRIKYLDRDERARCTRRILDLANVPAPDGVMLDRDAVRALRDIGMDVGAHTVSHPILARLDPQEARREIVESKQELEALTGTPVRLFAYPNGRPGRDYGPEHVRIVQEAGFEAAVTTATGAADRSSDPYQLPRFTPWNKQPFKFDVAMVRNLYQRAERCAA